MKTLPVVGIEPRERNLRAVLAGLVLISLAACTQQTLLSKQSERSANEVVAALRMECLDAEKIGRDGAYEVRTRDADFARSVQMLEARGLPRKHFDSLGEVFKREGFVSSPLEERARLLYALQEEMSNTLSSIDGILLARVQLVVPEKHPLAEKVAPSSASVLVKHRPGLNMQELEPKVKGLLVNGVEGLPYQGVTVVAVEADARLAAAPSCAATMGALPWPLALSSGLGALALVAAGLFWWRARRQAATSTDPGPQTPANDHGATLASAHRGAVAAPLQTGRDSVALPR